MVIEELNRITKEKDKIIKAWEEQCTKDVASHEKEVEKLDNLLTETTVEINLL